MSTSSISPSTDPQPIENNYNQLNSALHPSPPAVLEIDILPSTYPPQILYDHPALAIPKSLLARLFLHARAILLDSSPQSVRIGDEDYDAKLKATSVILLFDPNYVTAANFRKRYIQGFCRKVEAFRKNDGDGENVGLATRLITAELVFLKSLLTSPLHKHAKASTLWAQRLWMIRNYLQLIIHVTNGCTLHADKLRTLWNEELTIVMKAGERHPRNYYAWQYARNLSCVLQLHFDGSSSSQTSVLHQTLLIESLARVHAWCLMHPRDISGWSFLVFWLQKLTNKEVRSGEALSKRSHVNSEVSRVIRETREWVTKYDWKGESVEWFLRAVMQLSDEKSVTVFNTINA